MGHRHAYAGDTGNSNRPENLRFLIALEWLDYPGKHWDGGADHDKVIKEHERFERRPLTQFFNQTFDEAMRCRLIANMKTVSSTSEENP